MGVAKLFCIFTCHMHIVFDGAVTVSLPSKFRNNCMVRVIVLDSILTLLGILTLGFQV